jgi:tetratricopeptide (TPR) repeat protein
VDKSLVIVDQEHLTSETRYRFLETLRQYALERLIDSGEAFVLRDSHLEYYLTLAEKAETLLFGGKQAVWVHLLDTELDNIRAAIEWATNTGKAEKALRIAGSVVYYWFAHRLAASEWQDWVQTALACPEGRTRTLARAKALNGIGFMYFGDVVPNDLRPVLEEALSIAREFNDQWNTATALRNLGLMENVNGNYMEARKYLDESLELWQKIGPDGKFGHAWTMVFLGDVALNRGETELARKLYEEVVFILRGTGDINFLAYSVRRLGQLLWREGEWEEAFSLCKESLDHNLNVGSPRGVISCLAGFAAIAIAEGKYPRAGQLMSAVETQMVSLGITPMYMDQQEFKRNYVLLHETLNEKTLHRYWVKGKEMSLDEAIAFALDE